jgi:hypothetical protein
LFEFYKQWIGKFNSKPERRYNFAG